MVCSGGVRWDCFGGEIKWTLRRPSQEDINKSSSQTSQGLSAKPALPEERKIGRFDFSRIGDLIFNAFVAL